ncbi:MAG: hypothetical protein NTW32_19125 [Chloroflexi bacterium]|nr:hypothetical protein [Chloroflexota bacterium]
MILFYFFGQTRFLGDIISQFTLIAIMGYWQLKVENMTFKSIRAKFFLFGANILLVVSLMTGLLLSFSGEQNRFQKLNPNFFEKIDLVVDQLLKK